MQKKTRLHLDTRPKHATISMPHSGAKSRSEHIHRHALPTAHKHSLPEPRRGIFCFAISMDTRHRDGTGGIEHDAPRADMAFASYLASELAGYVPGTGIGEAACSRGPCIFPSYLPSMPQPVPPPFLDPRTRTVSCCSAEHADGEARHR